MKTELTKKIPHEQKLVLNKYITNISLLIIKKNPHNTDSEHRLLHSDWGVFIFVVFIYLYKGDTFLVFAITHKKIFLLAKISLALD